MSVFRYLNRAELLACMTVCKAWYKWYVCRFGSRWMITMQGGSTPSNDCAVLCRSCDKRLWSHIDVSRCSPLSNQALAGIIKRHPTSLDLSWTPLAMRQLNCLLTRLPGTNRHKRTSLWPYNDVKTCLPPSLCFSFCMFITPKYFRLQFQSKTNHALSECHFLFLKGKYRFF